MEYATVRSRMPSDLEDEIQSLVKLNTSSAITCSSSAKRERVNLPRLWIAVEPQFHLRF